MKTMKIDATMPISRLAVEVPGATAVFESLGLDYACAADRSLVDAAHAAGIDLMIVLASLRRLSAAQRGPSWNDRPLIDLQEHLVGEHHRFVRDELAVIAMRMSNLCTSSDAETARLVSLRVAFTKLSDLVLPHMRNEEQNVFPVIEALEGAWQLNQPWRATQGEFHAVIAGLVAEHGRISALLRTMRELRLTLSVSDNLPAACGPLLESVATLEAHLHEYMFLENCVLFPRAIALEKQLLEAASASG